MMKMFKNQKILKKNKLKIMTMYNNSKINKKIK